MKVLIVTEAVNRKHGANGSLIDLAEALEVLGYDVYTLTTARSIFFAWIESLINLRKLPKRLLGAKTKHLPDDFNVVFLIGNVSKVTMDLIKRDCTKAKLGSFQTSNVDLNSDRRPFIESLDVLCFQSPMQLSQYNHIKAINHSFKLPNGLFVGATCREEHILQAKMINFGTLPTVSIFGSIQPRKGQLEFCQIIERNPSVFKRFQINFFGPMHSGSFSYYCTEFSKILARLSCSGLNVKYWGDRSDYIRFLKGSDVILSYSSEEGLSTIIRESLFLKKLVVATNISGNSGTLDDSNSYVIERNEESVVSLFESLDPQSNTSQAKAIAGKKHYDENLSKNIFQQRLQRVMHTL